MRLVCRSVTYSLAVLLSMYAVSSSAAEKYKLTVRVTPADSTIKIDPRVRVVAGDSSQLGYRLVMELAPGRYDLVVTHEGYKPLRKQVTISTADVTLDVALEIIKYKLTVQATPPDSTIKFDNSKLEYRPGMELAPGRYDLVVSHEGCKPARRQVTISTADVTLQFIDFCSEKYKLTVQATPPDSTIKFDNSKLEYRPGMELAPGRYEVLVTHDGYQPMRRWVTIYDADVSLDVALDPEK